MFLLNKAVIKDNPEIHKEKPSSVHKHSNKSSEGSFSEVFNNAHKNLNSSLDTEKNLNTEKKTSVGKHSHTEKNKAEKSLKVSGDISVAERCCLSDKEIKAGKLELKEIDERIDSSLAIQIPAAMEEKEQTGSKNNGKTAESELVPELLDLSSALLQVNPKHSERAAEEGALSEKHINKAQIKENLSNTKQECDKSNKSIEKEVEAIKPDIKHAVNPTANNIMHPEAKALTGENSPNLKQENAESNKSIEREVAVVKSDIKPAVNPSVNDIMHSEAKTESGKNHHFKEILKAESTKTDEEPKTVKTDSKEILIARSVASSDENNGKSSVGHKKESFAEDKVSVKAENNAGIPAQKNENSLKQDKDNNSKDANTEKIPLKLEKSEQSDKQIQEKPSFALPNTQNDSKTAAKENTVVLNLLQDTMFKGTDINTVMQSIKNHENPEVKDVFSNNLTKFVAEKTFELVKNAQIENNKLTITIKPDNLGKIEINLISSGGILSAEINADNQDVKNILNSGLDSLKNSLAEKGLTLDKVTVNFSQSNMQNNSRNDFAQDYNLLNKSGYDFNSNDNKSNGESYPYSENKTNTGAELYESVLDFNEEIQNDVEKANIANGRIDYRI